MKKHHAVALSLKKGFVTLKLSLEEHIAAKLTNWGKANGIKLEKNRPDKKETEKKGKILFIYFKKGREKRKKDLWFTRCPWYGRFFAMTNSLLLLVRGGV